jgi:hypothetical protein
MLDIVLMILLSNRLWMAYRAKNRPVGGKVFKMLAFWLLAEVLIFYACIYLETNLMLTALLTMLAGVTVGLSAYRQAMEALKEDSGGGGSGGSHQI